MLSDFIQTKYGTFEQNVFCDVTMSVIEENRPKYIFVKKRQKNAPCPTYFVKQTYIAGLYYNKYDCTRSMSS